MELWQCKKGIPTYLESATKKNMLATSYLLGLINNHLRLLQNQRKKLTKILHYGNKYNKTIDTILTIHVSMQWFHRNEKILAMKIHCNEKGNSLHLSFLKNFSSFWRKFQAKINFFDKIDASKRNKKTREGYFLISRLRNPRSDYFSMKFRLFLKKN